MASMPLHNRSTEPRFPAAGKAVCPLSVEARPWRDAADPALVGEWAELAHRATEPNPFAEPWFVIPSLQALDPAGSVELVTLRKAGALRAILPVSPSRSYFGYPIPHKRLWLHDNAFCGQPLVEAGHEAAFWQCLTEWADAQSGPDLFLHIGQMPEESAVFAALKAIVHVTHRPAAVVRREARAQLRSSLDSESYFAASMSGKKRKELRRQAARLADLGHVITERLTGTEQITEWVEEFLALEAGGWKGREESALASDVATSAMFRATLSAAAAAGKLERLALRLDGAPIAMLVNFLTPPGVYSFKTAFDERYARFSPGVLLQRENLNLLDNPAIDWADSCAAADHPMIERIWREKRSMVSVNIGIGGALRRALFTRMIRHEASAELIGHE